MRIFRNFSLGRKLVFTMMATSSASLLVACLSFLSYDVLTFRGNVADHLTILADMTGFTIENGNANDGSGDVYSGYGAGMMNVRLPPRFGVSPATLAPISRTNTSNITVKNKRMTFTFPTDGF